MENSDFARAIKELIECRSAVRVAAAFFLYTNKMSVALEDQIISGDSLTSILKGDELKVFNSRKNSNDINFVPLLHGMTFMAEYHKEANEDSCFINGIIERISNYDSRIKELFEQYKKAYRACNDLNPLFVREYEYLFGV